MLISFVSDFFSVSNFPSLYDFSTFFYLSPNKVGSLFWNNSILGINSVFSFSSFFSVLWMGWGNTWFVKAEVTNWFWFCKGSNFFSIFSSSFFNSFVSSFLLKNIFEREDLSSDFFSWNHGFFSEKRGPLAVARSAGWLSGRTILWLKMLYFGFSVSLVMIPKGDMFTIFFSFYSWFYMRIYEFKRFYSSTSPSISLSFMKLIFYPSFGTED